MARKHGRGSKSTWRNAGADLEAASEGALALELFHVLTRHAGLQLRLVLLRRQIRLRGSQPGLRPPHLRPQALYLYAALLRPAPRL